MRLRLTVPMRFHFRPPSAPDALENRARRRIGVSRRRCFLLAGAILAFSLQPFRSSAQSEIQAPAPPLPSAGSLQAGLPVSAVSPDLRRTSAVVSSAELTVENVEAGAPAIGATIEGINFDEDATNAGFYHIPPDPHGAVGPNHVVSVVNTSIEWHTKAGVQQNSQRLGKDGSTTAGSFFAPVNPVNGTFDPKVIYDPHAGRFVVVTLERQDIARGDAVNTSRILVAVSDDNDPNGTWRHLAINSLATIGGVDHWADYPGFAVDEDAIYITNNMFTFGATGTFGGTRLWIVNKNPLYSGGAGTFTIHNPYAAAGTATTTQPAQIVGAPPGGATGTFLVSYGGLSNGTDEFLQIVRVDNPISAPAFSQQFVNIGNIDNTAGTYADAPQAGTATLINSNDRRAQNAVWRNNRLYTCATTVPPNGPDAGQVTARHWELNTTSPAAISLVQSAAIGGEEIASGTYTFFPSVAVNSLGDVCVGFAASAPSIFCGAYAAIRLAGDPPGTFRPPLTIAAGQDFYIRKFSGTRNRWGDYSGMVVDPADDLSFWGFNEYALARGTAFGGEDGRWGTRWARVSLDNAAPIVTLPGPAISFPENDPAIVLDATATVTDPGSPDFNAGSLTLDFSANGAAEDRLAIRNQGTAAGQIGVSGNTVTFGGATIGTFTGGTNGSTPLVVAFTTSAATPAAAQALARNLTYQNVSDNPSVATRTARLIVNDGDGASSTASTKSINVTAVNDSPTLTAIANPPAIFEDAGPQTTNLTGISAGGGENQTLTITATSSNPAVIPNPTVSYTSPGASGSLTYLPVADASGSAVITVTLQDSGGTANGGVDSIVRTFTVNVSAVNDAPTLAAIANPAALSEDAGGQILGLSGISAGGGESQTLAITATSDNTAVIPHPAVTYTSPNAIGSLSYTPVANASGSATITVTVQDNGETANGGQNSTIQTFTISVTPVNDAPSLAAIADPAAILEDAGAQVVAFSGVAAGAGENQTLTVSATSSNPALIPNPAVTYTSPNATGSLSYTPVPNASGSAVITVTVLDNGGTANGGVNSVARTFTVNVTSVNDAPNLASIPNPAAILEDAPAQTVNLSAISAGAGESQALAIIATSSDPGVVPNPTVNYTSPNATGSLSYTPVAGASGSVVITVTLQDNGGTANGGQDTAIQTFTILVTSVNDAPTLAAIGDPAPILEDAGGQTVNLNGITAGAGESQTLTVTATSSNPTVIPDPTVSYASANTTGSLSYTPIANGSGQAVITVTVQDSGGTANGGVNTSTRTFTVNVTGVNDSPTLAQVANPAAIPEDAGAQTMNLVEISAGAGESQTLTLTAVSDNPAVIPNPTVTYTSPNASGSLGYTPVADASGSATITVTVTDSGGTANGGVNSITQTFVVNVTPVNDPPTFAAIANPAAVLEDALAQSVNLAGISAGGGETQALIVSAVSDNSALIPNPTVTYTSPSTTGSLAYTPVANANGIAVITVTVTEAGGGGLSVSTNFTVSVTAVNDPPAFTKGLDQSNLEDGGLRTVNGWATNILAGPANESGQTVSFSTTNTNAALFASAPAVSPTGTLTFTPAANAFGTAVVTITATDTGGTANGGVATSSQTFNVSVTPVNDPPSFTKGADQIVLEDSGPRTVAGWANAISAGPNEPPQVITFTAVAADPSLFSTQPAVAANGTLTFTPVPNTNGTTTITVSLRDDGGTLDGGQDTSSAQIFNITVTAVNDAPGFTLGGDQTGVEDSEPASVPGFLSASNPGPPNESAQAVTITVSNNNPSLFETPPAIGASGTLTYATAANAFGAAIVTVTATDDGGVLNDGVNTSAQTFTITVTNKNDAPEFVQGGNLGVLEDSGPITLTAWVTGISAGPPNESAQTITFLTTVDEPTRFSVVPAVSADGTLTFTPAPDATGTVLVTVRARDNGGTENGGVETSAPETFTIELVPVNDPPVFASGGDVLVEAQGARITLPWATGIRAGPADEAAQPLTFIVAAADPSLFLETPSIDPLSGALTFIPLPEANGSTAVTVQLMDNAGIVNGGNDTSATQSFSLQLRFINKSPQFTKGSDLRAARDAGPQTVAGWATAISPGPANEAAQSLTFIVENDQPSLFAAPPAISANGTLTYTPAPNGSGKATITVRLRDSGGTANDGRDTSDPQSFEIAITSLTEELGGAYVALAQPAPSGSQDNARVGFLQVKMSRKGTFSGKLALGGKSYALKGSFGEDGMARFGKDRAAFQTLTRRNAPSLALQFGIDVADGSGLVIGTIMESKTPFSSIDGDRVAYTSARVPVPPLVNPPPELPGPYTVVFPALTPAEQVRAATEFPQGDGYGRVIVSRKGTASLKAVLADGTRISSAAPIAISGRWPIYRALGRAGSVSGFTTFRDVAEVSDLDGQDLLWIKPASTAGAYPNGWPSGIDVDLAGTAYAAPNRRNGGQVLPGLEPPDIDGNATLALADGGVPPAGLSQQLAIDAMNRVQLLAPLIPQVTVKLAVPTGLFTGTFRHPLSGKKTKFGGAVLQKQRLGAGFFLDASGSGSATLVPQAPDAIASAVPEHASENSASEDATNTPPIAPNAASSP